MTRATIADVAARAGVSKSTVSHALSGKRPISVETRTRIQQAIDELGYQPHPIAQRLAGGRTRTVGFVFPLFAPHITGLEMKFITGAANIINQADYAFLLLTHPQPDSSHVKQFMQSGLVDGFILMQVHLTDPRVELLRQAALPFVLVGRCADNSGLTYVDLDINQAMTVCVDHLAGLGHQTIAYLHQDAPDFGFAARALHSFSVVCQQHQLTPISQPCTLSSASGAAAMQTVLEQHPETTAVIIWNDTAAWGAVQAAQAHGRRIPQELSLICFEFAAISNLLPFKPTVVDIHAEKIAAQAASMMIALLQNDWPLERSQVLLAPTLIIGDSTAPPPEQALGDNLPGLAKEV